MDSTSQTTPVSVRSIPVTETSVPFGTAGLSEPAIGVALSAHGYVEHEYELAGVATEWTYDEEFRRRPVAVHPYRTRVLVRRPADPARFSGVAQLEPLHPSLDSAFTWRNVHPWIMRSGHAWVGVTHDKQISEEIRTLFPERYDWLSLPVDGLTFDILGQLALALKAGDLDGLTATQVVLSGWSMTGSFTREFLQEGFNDAYTTADGTRPIDAAAICISAGGAHWAGFPPLSQGCALLPDDHPRRTVSGHGIPVFEIMSECESEGNATSTRDDSDDPTDPYRLYQVAGTSHTTTTQERSTTLTNATQYARAGGRILDQEVNEPPSDARLDEVARALFALLDRWMRTGAVPPRAPRFSWSDPLTTRTIPVLGTAHDLARDEVGNVIGGIRPPWVDVPLSVYLPHSTPVAGRFVVDDPKGSPDELAAAQAGLLGYALPLPEERIRSRYADEADYLAQLDRSIARLVSEGYLCEPEAGRLRQRLGEKWGLMHDASTHPSAG
ncbi:alpha/beta hydrolase domain-containing protein [Microbacterium sp.]|uniref:alpha/beta hydrolase domain-containing protein n=1 Tax=Microbacterium sp. TaxID=51671 RepID=UPI00092729DB|nr:alpha/beta hydrolase domain-containing protein [Microbacterium sp.]MBN9188362.1 hypothetical protein [Microbacterium sp.]MBN9192030.1 hypothetical protein [Microbacterium sp.]OJU58287.1 MAG: hypothetical protein BGO04_02105 [Microbacterium sp. 70-38]